jgi:hypothetical protein
VVGEHQALLQASARPFVAALFPPEAEANGSAPVRGAAWHCGGQCCPGLARSFSLMRRGYHTPSSTLSACGPAHAQRVAALWTPGRRLAA